MLYLVSVSSNNRKKNGKGFQLLLKHYCKTFPVAESYVSTAMLMGDLMSCDTRLLALTIISLTVKNASFQLFSELMSFTFLRSRLGKSLLKDVNFNMNRL